MNDFFEQNVSLQKCPALVLNADYRPLSYYPLSLWSWQDTVKSVFLDRVIIVSNYDRTIRSPSFSMLLKYSDMQLNQSPYRPSTEDLHKNGKNFPPNFLHKSWMDYLYWDVELES